MNGQSRLSTEKRIQIDFLDENGNCTCSQQTNDRYTAANFRKEHERLSKLDLGNGTFAVTAYSERFAVTEMWP